MQITFNLPRGTKHTETLDLFVHIGRGRKDLFEGNVHYKPVFYG